MANVRVKVLRPLMYLGERRERDEVLKVSPTDAWQLCSSGRAELADPRDNDVVVEAVRAETARVLRLERQHASLPPQDPRWIPRF